MKKIPVEQAVGSVLCHDITQIIPGEFKGRRFKKGHIVREEDIPVLLSLGKDHLYVWEDEPGMVHENDAAIFLKDIAMGQGLTFGEIKEGKISFNAAFDGLLKINAGLLTELNMLGEISFATLMNDTPVKKGQNVAAARVIPLVIRQEKLDEAKALLNGTKIVSVLPLKPKKAGIVTTGSEVYYHRIEDKFGPVIRQKMEQYGCEVMAMFLMAYSGDIPVMGLPGCVMHAKTTVFDIVLPKILAGETITLRDTAVLGHGGLCMQCDPCRYPICHFGKGD